MYLGLSDGVGHALEKKEKKIASGHQLAWKTVDGMEEDPNGRFICEACARRFDDGGDCPHCDGEPLLDLADEEVVLMLEGFDAAAQRRRYFHCFLGASVVAIPIGLALFIGATAIDVRAVTKLAFLVAAGLLIGLTTLLAFLFPARRKLPKGFAAGLLSGSAGVPSGQIAARAPGTGSGACVACGSAIDPRSAYLDDDGRTLCFPCFEKGQAADLDIAAAKEVVSGGVVGALRVGAMGVAGAVVAQGVSEDLKQTRAWKDPGDGEDDGEAGT